MHGLWLLFFALNPIGAVWFAGMLRCLRRLRVGGLACFLLACEPAVSPEPGTVCMEGEADPMGPAYHCSPEWYTRGRDCRGNCEEQGQDVWICREPDGGPGAAWAPPNCVQIGEWPGERRYCCSCAN